MLQPEKLAHDFSFFYALVYVKPRRLSGLFLFGVWLFDSTFILPFFVSAIERILFAEVVVFGLSAVGYVSYGGFFSHEISVCRRLFDISACHGCVPCHLCTLLFIAMGIPLYLMPALPTLTVWALARCPLWSTARLFRGLLLFQRPLPFGVFPLATLISYHDNGQSVNPYVYQGFCCIVPARGVKKFFEIFFRYAPKNDKIPA